MGTNSENLNGNDLGHYVARKRGTKMRYSITALVATLSLTIGFTAMAQDSLENPYGGTDAGVDTDTAPDNTGLLQMDTSVVYRWAYPLTLNAGTFSACDYFRKGAVVKAKKGETGPAEDGFLTKVIRKLKKQDDKDILGNFATSGANAVCSLGPVTRKALWDGFHAHLIAKGCKPADPDKMFEPSTAWSGTCNEILSASKAISKKARGYVKNAEILALMDAMSAAADNDALTGGQIKNKILFAQAPLFMAPDEVWQPIFASGENVELGTLTDASALKAGDTTKAVCVGKKPVVGEVISTGDKLSIKTPDGKTVEMNAKDCVTYVASAFKGFHDGLEVGNTVVAIEKDSQLPIWGEIIEVVNDAEGKPTNVKVELEDGTVSDIALTNEQIILGKKIASAAAGSVSFSIEGTGWIGIGSTMPDHTKGVWAPTTMVIIRWTPEAMKGILSFHAGFGFGFAEGNTSYGIKDASQADRMFFIGKVGASAGYDVTSWLRPEVMGSLLYTAHGVGGEGGADLVFKAHKYVNVRVGARVGYIPTGVVPDTRPGRNTPALNGLFVGPALSLEFCIPY